MSTLAEILKADPAVVVQQLRDLERAIRSSRREIQRKAGVVSFNAVISAVSAEFRVGKEEILSRGRSTTVAIARQVAMSVASDVLGVSQAEVGRLFDRDHASVQWAIRSVQNESDTVPGFKARLARIHAQLMIEPRTTEAA